MRRQLDLSYFVEWLSSGERGISSEAIVSQLTGQPVGRHHWRHGDHPYDPADFRRCERLLRQYPTARIYFRELMPGRSDVWARMVEHWDELVELIESESPGVFDGAASGSAPEAYKLMRAIRDGGTS